MIREDELLDRITVRSDLFGGKPIIRGMRIAVEHVLANPASGETVESLLEDYPFLEPGDVRACLIVSYYPLRRRNKKAVRPRGGAAL